MEANYYEILGVSRTATTEEIKSAFRLRAMAQRAEQESESIDPTALQKFRLLREAYQTLTDPDSRAEYDASLTESFLGPPKTPDELRQLWARMAEIFFETAERYTPAVDALRESLPITIDVDDLIIVGLDPANAKLVGYLTTSDTADRVRSILEHLTGKLYDFRVILGTSFQEWISIKGAEDILRLRQRDQQAQPSVESYQEPSETPTRTYAVPRRPARPLSTAPDNWTILVDEMREEWHGSDAPTTPQGCARLLLKQIALVAQEDSNAYAIGAPEELVEHKVALALECISEMSGMDVSVVALEYLRYRSRLHGGKA